MTDADLSSRSIDREPSMTGDWTPGQWATHEFMRQLCVLCGHPYDDHVEPNSDTPVCTGCAPDTGPMPEPESLAWHAMGWPSEYVFSLLRQLETATRYAKATGASS